MKRELKGWAGRAADAKRPTPLWKILLRIAVAAFLIWMAIDLAPQVVPALNSLSNTLQQTSDNLQKTTQDLEAEVARAKQDQAQRQAQEQPKHSKNDKSDNP